MAHIGLFELRQALDEAITYANDQLARDISQMALQVARDKEMVGEMMYFNAQLKILDGDYAGAVGYLDAAINDNPYDGAAYNDKALCLVELGQVQEAFIYFDKGIAAEPDYATVYHNKGWLLNKLGRHEEAIGLLEQALLLEPERAVTYENLGYALRKLGRKKEACGAYQKALNSLEPRYSSIREQIETQLKSCEE